MSLDLDAIRFTVDTTELLDADKALEQIGVSAEAMAKRVSNAQTKTASSSKQVADATEAVVQADNKATEAKKNSVTMLDKQLMSMKILRGETIDLGESIINMGAGFTKSQSNQLAFMALSGKTSDELSKMANSFKEFANISGVNPFDKATSGITKMVRELNELKDVEKLARQEMSMTRDELINYMRDKQRLLQMNISEGNSLTELKANLRSLKSQYLDVGSALNVARANAKEQELQAKTSANASIQAIKDQKKANDTLISSMQKMDDTLAGFNTGLNKSSSDSLVKFQNALKLSGKSVEEQSALLDRFKTKLTAVQAAQEQSKVNYLSRAVGPQITDVVTSLVAGQNPMTVLLQQGGQLRDQFAMAGVESAKMAGIMRNSMRDMASSVKNTGIAMVSLLTGAITDAGTATFKFFGNQAASVFEPMALSARTLGESIKYSFLSMTKGKEVAEQYAGTLITVRQQQEFLTASGIRMAGIITGINIVAAVAMMVALAKATYDVTQEENTLNRSLNLTGASLGLNVGKASDLAKQLASSSATTSQFVETISEMAKASGFASSQIKMIGETAGQLEKTAGVPISDTVKRFEELGKSPTEALAKVAKEMGNVSASTLSQVANLESMGRKQEAAAIAMKAFADSSEIAVRNIKNNYGDLSTLFTDIGNAFGWMWDKIKSAVRENGLTDLSTQLQKAKDDLKSAQDRFAATPDMLKWTFNTKGLQDMQEKVNSLSKTMMRGMDGAAASTEAYSAALSQSNVNKAAEESLKFAKAEKAKTLSKKEFIEAGLKEIYGADLATAKNVENTERYQASIIKLTSEFEKLHKVTGGTQVPVPKQVDTAALFRNQYQDQQRALESNLQVQLNLQAKYRKLGLTTEVDSRNAEAMVISKSLDESLTALNDYYSKAKIALDSDIANTNAAYAKRKQTQANDGARANAISTIKTKQEELNSFFKAQNTILSDRAMNVYIEDVLSAGKALNDLTKALKDANAEEDALRGKRSAEQLSGIANAFASPEQAAYLKGYYEELNRLDTKQRQLNKAMLDAADAVEKSKQARDAAINTKSLSATDIGLLSAAYDAAVVKLGTLQGQYNTFKQSISGGAEIQGEAEKFKYFQDQLVSFIKTTESSGFLDKLNSGFTNAGDAVGLLVSSLQELTKSQSEYNAVREKMLEAGPSKDAYELEKRYAAAREAYTIKQISTGKKYFGEQTVAYKALYAIEKAYRVKQALETAKDYAVKLGLIDEQTVAIVKGWLVSAAASVTASATSIASLMGIGTTAGAVAPVVAAAGTPGPAAFVAFAAMAALVTKAGFGNGGGTTSWSNTGTGTVLGDSSAKSESLKGALSKLEDVSSKTMVYSSGMLASLKVIESNTAGLANLLVRSGAASAGDFGITEGNKSTILSTLASGGLDKLPMVGGLISKLSTALFGAKTTINSQGLMAQTGNLGSIFGNGLTTGTLGLSNYADVTTKKKFLGVTYSSNSSTQTTAASAETADQFSKIILGFVDSIKLAGNGLGVSTDTIIKNLEGFNLDLGKIDLKGLTGTEIQSKLEAVFGALGDKMAQSALGGLVNFQKVGEGYFETLVRVSSAVEESGLILKKLGVASIGYTDVLNKQGDVSAEIVRQSLSAVTSLSGVKSVLDQMTGTATEVASAFGVMNDAVNTLKFVGNSSADVTYNLLSAVGGFDSLSSAMSSFRDNYLTDAQKIEYSSQELSKQFAALGLVMPTSGAGFVELVKGIDGTTAAGQSLLGSVLGLSDAFSTVANEYTRVQNERLDLESQILTLQGKTSELRAIELAKLSPTNRALQEQIYLLTDQAAATEKLTSALSAAGTAITTEINRLRNAATGTSTESLASLQSKFALNTAAARSGDTTALGTLTDLSQSIETAAINSASTSAQVQQMRAWLASSLQTTAGTLGLDLSGLTNGTASTSSTNVVTATGSGLSTTSSSSLIDISGLLTELQNLRTEVQGLRTEVVAGVQYEAKISRTLDRVTQDGENVSVKITP
jgi:phage-related minor tail protein